MEFKQREQIGNYDSVVENTCVEFAHKRILEKPADQKKRYFFREKMVFFVEELQLLLADLKEQLGSFHE